MLEFNFYRAEFGNAVSTGLWLPYLYRKLTGERVGVTSSLVFDPEWSSLWFDEYHTDKYKHGEDTPGVRSDKRELESDVKALVSKALASRVFNSWSELAMPLPTGLPDMRETWGPYVVIMPVIYGDHNKREVRPPWYSLELRQYRELRSVINSLGLKCVAYATQDAVGAGGATCLEHIADHHFYGGRTQGGDKFLQGQLTVMKNAVTSVAVGGAAHVSLAFDVPGMGWDGQFVRNYKLLCDMMSISRPGFKQLIHPEGYADDIDIRHLVCGHGRDMEYAHAIWFEVIKRSLIKEIEQRRPQWEN